MAGYIKDHRKELSSDIWRMPPLYHRVWQYLKYKFNHGKAEMTLGDGTLLVILPGQCLSTLRTIAKGVGWQEQGKLYEPNPKTIDSILKWMRKHRMIHYEPVTGNASPGVRGNSYGTLITAINWDLYNPAAVKDNANSGDVTCYRGTEQESTATEGIGNISHLQGPMAEPFIQIVKAYCELHNRLDIHLKPTERQAIKGMYASGIPVSFVIQTMRKLYDAKCGRDKEAGLVFSQPSSFNYYVNAINEAWANKVLIGKPRMASSKQSGGIRNSQHSKNELAIRKIQEAEERERGRSAQDISGD